MTRKHFIAVANTINCELMSMFHERGPEATHEREAIVRTAGRLADTFATINPNFNRQRFLTACTKDTGVCPE